MENKEYTLPLELILKIASGRDSDGIPRSASAMAVERIISEKETENIAELFLEDAVVHIHQSSGASVLTFDFKYNALGLYRKCKAMCDQWMVEKSTDKQFSVTIAPFVLTGQIILIYTHLMFVDGYSYKNVQNQNVYRLILGFDNDGSYTLETREIDYARIQSEITDELKHYEDDIDEQIERIKEEEQKLKDNENQLKMNVQETLNHPLQNLMDEEARTSVHKNEDGIRFVEDNNNIRFTEEE